MSKRRGPAIDAAATRVVDVVLSIVILAFTMPFLLIIALMMKLTDRGPIIFSQRRIGINGEEFWCFKLRSMVVDADARLTEYLATHPAAQEEWARDHKLRKDPRITALGRMLRVTSIDELPQFVNVLLGDMSLVGPRPIVAAETIRYRRYFSYYCSVKPGITGLWQVSGRNHTTYRRRVALDVFYARRRSLCFDLTIMARTIPAVLLANGSF